ncbi:MAG: 2-phospho-L-lactate transferase CofD family protein, partial [Thermoleophilaceae bacterium]
MEVALLSGGTGGAKLARGLVDVVGGQSLAVIANTGDDSEVYGAHVSPDPDLVSYWLADVIDERGYGIAGDSWQVMDALAAAGRDTWFRLGDTDLAMCLIRTELMAAGHSATAAHAAVVEALGLDTHVLPATDQPVRTYVTARGAAFSFQEFMILEGARGPIENVEFRGAEHATPSRQALDALREANCVVIGPSNPIASIAPMLAVPGMRGALREAPGPVVAVSPFVGGRVLKGPTLAFCEWAGIEPTAAGLLDAYAGLLDGIVADEPVAGVPTLQTDVLMD